MLGHGARPGGILPTESIPRDGLRDLRRELESPGLAKALSARLLARSSANGTKQIVELRLRLIRPYVLFKRAARSRGVSTRGTESGAFE
jgi:hypothetical protein